MPARGHQQRQRHWQHRRGHHNTQTQRPIGELSKKWILEELITCYLTIQTLVLNVLALIDQTNNHHLERFTMPYFYFSICCKVVTLTAVTIVLAFIQRYHNRKVLRQPAGNSAVYIYIVDKMENVLSVELIINAILILLTILATLIELYINRKTSSANNIDTGEKIDFGHYIKRFAIDFALPAFSAISSIFAFSYLYCRVDSQLQRYRSLRIDSRLNSMEMKIKAIDSNSTQNLRNQSIQQQHQRYVESSSV